MLRFLNLRKLIITEAAIIRQPSVLATRGLSASSWLDQASGMGKKGSKDTSKGKGSSVSGSNSPKGNKGSKSSIGSSSGGRFFGNKKSSPGRSGNGNSVCNDKASHRFTMDLGNNQVARIDYKSIGRNKIELYHTEVPSELRGKGIGKALARGALEQAAKSNMKVKLSCSYLINNLDKFADAKLKKILEK